MEIFSHNLFSIDILTPFVLFANDDGVDNNECKDIDDVKLLLVNEFFIFFRWFICVVPVDVVFVGINLLFDWLVIEPIMVPVFSFRPGLYSNDDDAEVVDWMVWKTVSSSVNGSERVRWWKQVKLLILLLLLLTASKLFNKPVAFLFEFDKLHVGDTDDNDDNNAESWGTFNDDLLLPLLLLLFLLLLLLLNWIVLLKLLLNGKDDVDFINALRILAELLL